MIRKLEHILDTLWYFHLIDKKIVYRLSIGTGFLLCRCDFYQVKTVTETHFRCLKFIRGLYRHVVLHIWFGLEELFKGLKILFKIHTCAIKFYISSH